MAGAVVGTAPRDRPADARAGPAPSASPPGWQADGRNGRPAPSQPTCERAPVRRPSWAVAVFANGAGRVAEPGTQPGARCEHRALTGGCRGCRGVDVGTTPEPGAVRGPVRGDRFGWP